MRHQLLLGLDLLGRSLGQLQLLELHHRLGVVGQELVQRRVEQADGHRQALHRPEDAVEVLALERQQLGQVLLALGGVGRHDHVAHVRQALLLHEHVLGAAEADALGAELAGLLRILRRVGVGAHLQAAHLVGPAQYGVDVLVRVRRPPAWPGPGSRGRWRRPCVIHSPALMILPPMVNCPALSSIFISCTPAMQGLPMPRATTAACEVMPPWLVMTPWACIRPWMSSGLVSQRTRMTGSPLEPFSSASSAVKTTWPTPAPGEAPRPVARTFSS